VVQATTEYGTVFDNFVAPLPGAGPDPVERALDRAMHACSAHVVTPSAWSREGFLRSGARAARVHVVPHGVNTARFRPRPAPERDALRARHGWTDDFVFLSIGAMTPNKNIDGLLRAFAAVLAKRPRARLALKGADHAFASGQKVRAALALIPPADAARAAARTTYIGSDLTIDELAGLYAAADAYAAPYRAEGFCLPALEAAACGLPLIVTRGGPTDDFTTGAFALPVKATKRHHPTDGWLMLEPDQRALEAQMLRAIDDATFRKSAATAGPAHAATFTWERAADQLLAVLLPDSPVP
jgi:glycosyltransferase involved in cell wall biosynthesis